MKEGHRPDGASWRGLHGPDAVEVVLVRRGVTRRQNTTRRLVLYGAPTLPCEPHTHTHKHTHTPPPHPHPHTHTHTHTNTQTHKHTLLQTSKLQCARDTNNLYFTIFFGQMYRLYPKRL